MTDRDRTMDYIQYRHRAHALSAKSNSTTVDATWSDTTLLQISRLEARFEKLTSATRLLYSHHKKTLKDWEASIVPWTPDDQVEMCSVCSVDLSLGVLHLKKRRHHCRLCGSVTCRSIDCSLLMHLPSSASHGSGLHQSLSTDELASGLRVCTKCSALLESSHTHADMGSGLKRNESHCDETIALVDAFLSIVDQLKSRRHLLDIQYDLYLESLTSGTKLASPSLPKSPSITLGVSLDRLTKLRKVLLELFSHFEKLLFKLQSIEIETEAEPRNLRQFRTLVRNVRMEYSMYLQELMISLPFLPKQQEREKGAGFGETGVEPDVRTSTNSHPTIETDVSVRSHPDAIVQKQGKANEKGLIETNAPSFHIKNWLPSLVSFGDAMMPSSSLHASSNVPQRPVSPLTDEQRSILEMQLSLLQTNLKESIRTRQLDAIQPLREAIQDIHRVLESPR